MNKKQNNVELIKDHADFEKCDYERLLGVYSVGVECGKEKMPMNNPFKNRSSIESFAYSLGYSNGYGEARLPTIDDLKWLDIVHLKACFNPFISPECMIVRPSEESIVFVGNDEDVESIRNVFSTYYSGEEQPAHFLCTQFSSKYHPLAIATLSFKKLDEDN